MEASAEGEKGKGQEKKGESQAEPCAGKKTTAKTGVPQAPRSSPLGVNTESSTSSTRT